MARVNGVQWYDENQSVAQQNRQPNWDFYSATPFNAPPNAGPSNPPPPPPPPASFYGFSKLPAELRNVVWDADLEIEEPVMRFVTLRQSVRHFPGCTQLAGCVCFAQRPNYITFHPLLRSDLDILVGLMMGEYWEIICRTTDRPSRAQVASYVNHERRTTALSTRARGPAPHRQGDWSLTQIPQDVRNADIVGEPWRCNEQDLVLVRFPGDMDPWPLYTFNAHTDPFVAFDPVVEQLTTIAMYVNNWDTNCRSRCVESAHNRMRRNRSWQRVEQHGLDAILNETTGAAGRPTWPPADVLSAATRYPNHPQRELRSTYVAANMPQWDQNMRLFTDVFTSLRHLWLVDWGMYWHMTDVSLFDEYRNASCQSDEECDLCEYAHPGYPKVWGGLAEVEFIEIRQCWPHWGCEIEEMYWTGYKDVLLDHWPGFDVNGLPFLRRPPSVGIIACIIRRAQA